MNITFVVLCGQLDTIKADVRLVALFLTDAYLDLVQVLHHYLLHVVGHIIVVQVHGVLDLR